MVQMMLGLAVLAVACAGFALPCAAMLRRRVEVTCPRCGQPHRVLEEKLLNGNRGYCADCHTALRAKPERRETI
jgi:RNase P subunit RPR2